MYELWINNVCVGTFGTEEAAIAQGKILDTCKPQTYSVHKVYTNDDFWAGYDTVGDVS